MVVVSVFLAIFLLCAGTSTVLGVYFCLHWYAATYQGSKNAARNNQEVVKNSQQQRGLEKLLRTTGKDLVLGNDCAVCFDGIGSDEPARLLPGCNHGFHLQCADAWLTKHPVCPLCRAKLGPELFDPPETDPC